MILACENVAATCSALAAHGVQITQEPKQMPWGVYAQFVDPDGNEFVLTGP